MKKIGIKLVIALVVLVLLSMSFSSLAQSAKDSSSGSIDTQTRPVDAQYQAASIPDTVYSVDVAWGALQFVYNSGMESVWNPATHEFEEQSVSTPSWTSALDADKITVTNHSNAAVAVVFTYTPDSEFVAIDGDFVGTDIDNGTANLLTAVGTTFADAPKVTASLELTGVLPNTATAMIPIGGVTVAISAVG